MTETPASGSRFRRGDVVRVRRGVLTGNPRTPKYVRGRDGVVVAVHGSIPNPLDHRGLYPPLYTAAFPVREIFPGRATASSTWMYEDWLEPA